MSHYSCKSIRCHFKKKVQNSQNNIAKKHLIVIQIPAAGEEENHVAQQDPD